MTARDAGWRTELAAASNTTEDFSRYPRFGIVSMKRGWAESSPSACRRIEMQRESASSLTCGCFHTAAINSSRLTVDPAWFASATSTSIARGSTRISPDGPAMLHTCGCTVTPAMLKPRFSALTCPLLPDMGPAIAPNFEYQRFLSFTSGLAGMESGQLPRPSYVGLQIIAGRSYGYAQRLTSAGRQLGRPELAPRKGSWLFRSPERIAQRREVMN